MKPHRAVVCTLAAALVLSGCTDMPTQSTTASPEASVAPVTGWQSIPDFPLTPRTEPVVSWSGEELLVIGGIPGPPCPPSAGCVLPEFARDGAAYDPESRTWTELPDAPVGVAATSAVFVGETLYTTLWRFADHTQLLSYDTATSTWAVQEAPDGLWRTPVADGDRLLLVANSDEAGEADDLIFDIASGEWSTLPADPLGPSFDRVMTAIPDAHVLTATPLVGSPDSEAPTLVTVARFDARAQEWTRLPDTDQLGGGTTWMLAGNELIAVQLGGADGGGLGNWGRTYPHGGILTLPDGAWSPLADAPEPDLRAWLHHTAVSDRFAVSGGYVYDHALRTWTALGKPPGAPTEAGPAVWAEHTLLVVGGVDWTQPGGHISEKVWIYRPPTESDDF